MIYRMEKYLGNYVVLPMVVVYAVLHFGKPRGETLGCIGGGYILGILALRTKNIYGGIAIHMGIAFLMEVCALLANKSYF
jgi:membrane protease YdiL (CAAX protease family)